MAQNYDIYFRVHTTSDDKAIKDYEKSLSALRDRLMPLQAAHEKWRQEQAQLKRALDEGRITMDQYRGSMDLLNREFKEQHANTAKSTGLFSGLKGELLGMAAAVVGIQQIGSFLKDAVAGAAAEERTLGALTMMIKQFDAAEGQATPKIQAFAKAMEAQGVEDDKVYEGLRDLIPVAGTLDNAIAGVKLAIDIASTGLKTYSEALTLVRDLTAGKDRSLMQAQVLLGEKSKTTDEALQKMYGRFGGYTEKMQDSQKEIDKVTTQWAAMKDEVGEKVLPILMWAGQRIMDLITYVGLYAKTTSHSIQSMVQFTATLFGGLWDSVAQRSLAPFNAAVKTALKQVEADVRTVAAMWKEGFSSAEAPTAKTGAPKRGPGGGGEDDGKAAKQTAGAILDLAQAMVQLRQAETQEAAEALRNAEGKKAIAKASAAVEEALKNQQEAERKLLAVQKTQALSEVKGNLQATASVQETYRLQELALEKKFQSDLLKLKADASNKELAIDKALAAAEEKVKENQFKHSVDAANRYQRLLDGLDKKELKDDKKQDAQALRARLSFLKSEYEASKEFGDLEVQYRSEIAATQIALDKAVAQARIQENLASISTILGALGSMFGGNKAFAYAQAIINTYLAATNAMTTGDPYTAALRAAAVIAVGMAQVASIASTKEPEIPSVGKAAKGAYLDRPTMLMAGEAGDELVLPGKFTRLFTQMANTYQTQTVFNQNRTTHGPTQHINISTVTGARGMAELAEFERKRRDGQRAYDRRVLGANRVKVGSKRRA